MDPDKISVKTEMLIRKPVSEVFEAFVNPDITTKFWFTKSTGRLEEGKQLRWDWEMYNISISVLVKKIEPNKRIVIDWPEEGGKKTVEWLFTDRKDKTTFLSITISGFDDNVQNAIQEAAGLVEGFTFLLAAAKALLEHNIELNLVADRFPDGLPG